jgi:Flp pilus assembly protein TadD
MNSHSTYRKTLTGAVSSALAAALVVGFAASGSIAQAAPVHSKKAERKVAKSIDAAEKRVQKAPQDAAARASLGNAYLLAGRFESAVTALEDARFLGDTSARSALGLALAHVGVGNGAAAVAVLDGARDTLPVSDYGLALALAGETSRGVDVLAQSLRGGENTAKLRQNLAYAYALDGRWNEARLMASQDVPPDQLDKRITTWAKQGRPEDFRLRVATMIGTSVRADEGQPAYLAIARDPSREVASLPVPSLASATAPARTDSNGELPPVENGESFWLAEAARPEPVPAALAPESARTELAGSPPVPADSYGPAKTGAFEQAFVEPVAPPVAAPAPVVQTANVAAPVAQQPLRKTRKVAAANKIFPGVKAAVNGSHLVQLGSFSSKANAERAWSIFLSRNPELARFDRKLTEAVVNGKRFYRVSAAGFDRSSARQMCSTVRNRGGACILWAAGNPLPGAVRKD